MTDLFGFSAPSAPLAAAPVPAALSAEQMAKLERLRHFGTRYEAVVVRPDGKQALLAYCGRHSMAGLREALCQRAQAVIAFLDAPAGAEVTYPRRGPQEISITGGGVVRFSGRTQREAIQAGELPYVGGEG